jgi:hypothetical protein
VLETGRPPINAPRPDKVVDGISSSEFSSTKSISSPELRVAKMPLELRLSSAMVAGLVCFGLLSSSVFLFERLALFPGQQDQKKQMLGGYVPNNVCPTRNHSRLRFNEGVGDNLSKFPRLYASHHVSPNRVQYIFDGGWLQKYVRYACTYRRYNGHIHKTALRTDSLARRSTTPRKTFSIFSPFRTARNERYVRSRYVGTGVCGPPHETALTRRTG